MDKSFIGLRPRTSSWCQDRSHSTTSANILPGQIFSYPVRLTWEFTSDNPVRSVFPLWPVYGLPMLLLRWLWIGNGNDGEIPPIAVFWTLRVLMFVLSFVLEDWALHELVSSPRHRRVAVLLVASSYVTWTYQTHTFSNSIETLAVAWSLVLIDRIVENKVGRLHCYLRHLLTICSNDLLPLLQRF
jgi:phosphatidylinositol glycan class Z